jgi:two-component system OmpR family response regulator
MRTLIIESDPIIRKQISDQLNGMGYQVDITETIQDGEYYVNIRNYDLIVSELEIGTSSALNLLNTIKDDSSKTSFIVLSNKTDKESELSALRAGADDFIKKPFDFEIFIARIENKLKFGANKIITIEDLIISPDEEKITYQGKDIELKGKPFEVLTHLARHREQIVSKEQLLDAIWEEPELVTPNVIEVAINQVRQKIDKPLNISTIETIRRRGYRFCYPTN